jgi:hypothetical protein
MNRLAGVVAAYVKLQAAVAAIAGDFPSLSIASISAM